MRRSALSRTTRDERAAESLQRSAAERTEEALALFEAAVEVLRASEGLSRRAAVRRLTQSRQAGRRPSAVASKP
ncbi:MAG: hypothetical protein H6736_16010 [Alphaproteobacteria bacterium]|nr:hypothetical protein [Alphaproteobacteria bacterium]